MTDGPILFRDTRGNPVPARCDYCFALVLGIAPHGVGNPCPQKLKIDEAYVAKLDAERMYFIRAGGGTDRMVGALERMAPAEED